MERPKIQQQFSDLKVSTQMIKLLQLQFNEATEGELISL